MSERTGSSSCNRRRRNTGTELSSDAARWVEVEGEYSFNCFNFIHGVRYKVGAKLTEVPEAQGERDL